MHRHGAHAQPLRMLRQTGACRQHMASFAVSAEIPMATAFFV
jgi:hypothetical protein